MIFLSSNHFWCSITRRSASSFEKLTVFIGVTETKIDDFYSFVEIEEEVFWCEVTMYDVETRYVFNTTEYLLEEFTCFFLFYSLMLYNIIKQLTSWCVFHYQIQLLRRFYNLIKLYHMRMLNNFQNVNFTRNSFVICCIHYFAFFENLHSNSCFCKDVHADFDFAECSFADCFTEDVLSNFPLMWLQIKLFILNLFIYNLLRSLSFI